MLPSIRGRTYLFWAWLGWQVTLVTHKRGNSIEGFTNPNFVTRVPKQSAALILTNLLNYRLLLILKKVTKNVIQKGWYLYKLHIQGAAEIPPI